MELLGPDQAVARQKALDAKRAEEEQFAKDTLAQAGIRFRHRHFADAGGQYQWYGRRIDRAARRGRPRVDVWPYRGG